MSVDQRRRDVLVAEEFLDGPDIVAALEQVSRERVPVMPGPALSTLCRVPDYAGFKPLSRLLLGISLE